MSVEGRAPAGPASVASDTAGSGGQGATTADDPLGRRTGWVPVACDPWRASLLQEVSGLDTPPYRRTTEPGALLPPSYLSAQYINTFDLAIPDAPARLNGGNRCCWETTVRTGEALERQSTVVDVSHKTGRTGRLVLYEIETIYRRADSHEVVARAWNTAIRRYPAETAGEGSPEARPPAGSGSGGQAGSEGAAPAVPPGAEEVLRVRPTSRDLVRYAVATDDLYEAHYDLAFARAGGLPGVIVHGLLKLAWFARAAVEYCGPGTFVREIAGFYRGIDLVGEWFSVWCRPEPQDPSGAGRRRLSLYGVSANGAVSTSGYVEVERMDDASWNERRETSVTMG